MSFSHFIKLYREQKKHEMGDDAALDDVSDEWIDEYLRGCNAHLPGVVDPGPADYLSSYDVYALYASACKYSLADIW